MAGNTFNNTMFDFLLQTFSFFKNTVHHSCRVVRCGRRAATCFSSQSKALPFAFKSEDLASHYF